MELEAYYNYKKTKKTKKIILYYKQILPLFLDSAANVMVI